MRVLITGDRNWSDLQKVIDALADLLSGSIVVHGAAPGADTIAATVADMMGLEVVPFPAEWTKYGHPAGPIRNRQMLKEGGPFDLIIVFHSDLSKSKGTKDMVNICIAAGYTSDRFRYVR